MIRFDESVVPRASPDCLDEVLTRRFLREAPMTGRSVATHSCREWDD